MGKFLEGAERRMGSTLFACVVASLIGLASAASAIVLKSCVHGLDSLWRAFQGMSGLPWLLCCLPVAGIALTSLWARFFVKGEIGHGVSGVIESAARPSSRPKARSMVASLVGCSLTAGFGGSVGMEGPIFATGAAIGENAAALCSSDYRRRVILMGCGAAAAVSAIFKAPLAGAMFAIEMLALDLSAASLIPLLLSSALACLASMVFSGYRIEMHFAVTEPFRPSNIPLYALLGVACAFVSVFFMRVLRLVEGAMGGIARKPLRILAGGLLMAVAVLFLPPLFGEGYRSMNDMLSGEPGKLFAGSLLGFGSGSEPVLAALLVVAALVKPLACAVTTGSGGVGGTFAPALFSGCALGGAFAKLANLSGAFVAPEINFSLAGMAGLLAGTMHAPLTGIFLIAELSGGYQLFVPLIIVASVSYLITKRFEPLSIYSRAPGAAGRLITHDRDKAALTLLSLDELLEPAPRSFGPLATVEDISLEATRSRRDLYPIAGDSGELLGFVSMRNLRPLLASPELYSRTLIEDIISPAAATIAPEASVAEAVEAFGRMEGDDLPVVRDGKLVGFLSRARVYRTYREKLRELSSEGGRTRS